MKMYSKKSIVWKLAATAGALYTLLLALWVLPPFLNSSRNQCPLRPDGINEAGAVPSFARQTGMACEMCHTIIPQLTPYGRRFKLNGYTLTTKPAEVQDYTISDSTMSARRNLILSTVNPLSAEINSSYSSFNRTLAAPAGTTTGGRSQSDSLEVPQAIDLWAAGRVSDTMGAFVQLDYTATAAIKAPVTGGNPKQTYTGAGTVAFGPSEILRFAEHTDDRMIVWGNSLNNSLAKVDLWNTPLHAFFQFPGAASIGATPKAPLYTGGPGGSGDSIFAMINDSLYLEAGVAHQDPKGYGNVIPAGVDPGTVYVGFNPKFRAAYEQDWGDNALMVGGQISHTRYDPSGTTYSFDDPTISNDAFDMSADWEYQWITQEHVIAFLGAITTEQQSNSSKLVAAGAYSNQTDYIHQVSISGEYFYRRTIGGTITWVNNDGTDDVKEYGATGSPHNQYWQLELDYFPYLNTKFYAQYNWYTVLTGPTNNAFYSANGKVGSPASDANVFSVGVMYDF